MFSPLSLIWKVCLGIIFLIVGVAYTAAAIVLLAANSKVVSGSCCLPTTCVPSNLFAGDVSTDLFPIMPAGNVYHNGIAGTRDELPAGNRGTILVHHQ